MKQSTGRYRYLNMYSPLIDVLDDRGLFATELVVAEHAPQDVQRGGRGVGEHELDGRRRSAGRRAPRLRCGAHNPGSGWARRAEMRHSPCRDAGLTVPRRGTPPCRDAGLTVPRRGTHRAETRTHRAGMRDSALEVEARAPGRVQLGERAARRPRARRGTRPRRSGRRP